MAKVFPTKHTTKQTPARRIEELHRFPSAGPHPCVSGMKKLYWGKDALCVRHGAYVFHVDRETYDSF